MLRRTISSTAKSLCLGIACLGAGPVDAATPSDIQVLQGLIDSSEENKKPSVLKARLIQLALQQTDTLARSRGYPSSLWSSNPLVQKYITEHLSIRFDGMRPSQKQIIEIGLEIMSGKLPEEAIAYAAQQSAPSPPATKQETRPLSHSATVSGKGPLVLDLNQSRVINDVGTVGSNNGILDPGESAKLQLSFANVSDKRLMSTSLYVRSLSSCLLTTEHIGKEIQLNEMVGRKQSWETGEEIYPGRSTVTIALFASSECAGRNATVVMDAYDTHRFASKPIRYTLSLSLSDATTAQITNVRIDRDDYGHSEPAAMKIIQPKDRIEISADLSLRKPGYSFAYQQYLPPPGVLSAEHKPAITQFKTVNGRYIAPMYDDLDLTFLSKSALLRKLAPMARAYNWQNPQDARVYIAVDTVFGKRSKVAASSTGETTYVFSQAELRKALAEHIQFQVVPGAPKLPSPEDSIAVGAADGIQVDIREPGALLAELQSMDLQIKRPAVSKDGAYSVRHYIELPIFWEKTYNTVCSIQTADGPFKVGDSVPVDVLFRDVPIGSQVTVHGTRDTFEYTTISMSENIRAGSATILNYLHRVTLAVHDPEGRKVCSDTVDLDAEIIEPPEIDPWLPIASLTVNGHMGTYMYGSDVTITGGRKFGGVLSFGRLAGEQTFTVGGKASQLIKTGLDFAQLNLTETLQYGRIGQYTHVRGSVYLSLHRMVGANLGLHFESDMYGNLHLNPRIGFGGFLGAKYK